MITTSRDQFKLICGSVRAGGSVLIDRQWGKRPLIIIRDKFDNVVQAFTVTDVFARKLTYYANHVYSAKEVDDPVEYLL